jgi:transcriptional regulator with XRE-family HTH domain
MEWEKLQKMTLGKKVKEARLSLKMTQKKLAGEFITRNMLSQIENDVARPSIRTMEYLAKRLGKPVGYFVDDINEENEFVVTIGNLLNLYEMGEYIDVIKTIENTKNNKSILFKNKIIINIYINCYMKVGLLYKRKNDYIKAKAYFEKLLEFDGELAINEDIMLYKVYSQLAEVNSYISELDNSKKYNTKAKEIINKMIASKDIQSIYLQLIQGNYNNVIKMSSSIKSKKLDMYNSARYNMNLGLAFYNISKYKEAIIHLEKSLVYYKQQNNNKLTNTIYEKLSKCYTNLEKYDKDHKYLHIL